MEERMSSEQYVIGLDIGATKVNVGAFDTRGKLYRSRRFPTRAADSARATEYLKDCLRKFIAEYPQYESPAYIGIGVRGYTDRRNGIWQHTQMIPDFKPIPLAREFEQTFRIGTVIDNDVHAATMAELYFGAGKRYRDFIYLNIGTGIAAGIVSDRKLVRGHSNYAGEFGNILPFTAKDGGKTLEESASGMALCEHADELLMRSPDSVFGRLAENMPIVKALFEAYDRGDAAVRQQLDEDIAALGTAVHGLVMITNPGALVFGGGVMADGWLLPKLKEFLRAPRFDMPSMRAVEMIEPHQSAGEVGLYGAACLALEELRDPLREQ